MRGKPANGHARRLIVGVTDAPGAGYAIRLLEVLRSEGVETHLVVSEAARARLEAETDGGTEAVTGLADHVHQPSNQAARVSSGSFLVDGMIVAPCSPAAAAAIAHGLGADLLHRAADVTIKEGRPLALLVVDEGLSPMARENLEKLTSVPGVLIIRPVDPDGGSGATGGGDPLDPTVDLLLRSVGLRREG